MSKFLQALEQARNDRARPDSAAVEAPAAPAPTVSAWADVDEHLVSLLAPGSFEAEQYRGLRQLIEQRRRADDLSSIAVSSPGTGDGKTTTAINLAGALAQAADARVLLVDADLRRPALARRLGFADDARPGLVDAILDPTIPLTATVRSRPHLNLYVIGGGRPAVTPYELLKSRRLAELLGEARRTFDYVVLDTPPLVSVPDCQVLGKLVDGFLIVVTAHRTSRKLLEEALKMTEPAKVLGLVFNGDDRHLSRHAYASRRSRPSDRRHSAFDH